MKKLLSLIITACLMLSLCAPVSVFAKDVNDDKGMYKIEDKLYADAYMLVSLDDENDLVARYDSLKLVVASNLNKKDLAELLSLFTEAQDVLKDRMGE